METAEKAKSRVLPAEKGGGGGEAPPANDESSATGRPEPSPSERKDIEESLRSAIAELREREEMLRESEAQLRLVTDTLPVLVSFIDADCRYQFLNEAYERWFGHSRDELIGKHMSEVLGQEAYESIRPQVELALAGTSVTYETEIPYRDGGSRFVEATYIPKRTAQGTVTGFVVLVADASQRREFETARAAEATRADRLLRVTAGIADAVSTEEVFQALVDRVVHIIGASSGGLWLVDQDEGVARMARSCGYSAAVVDRLSVLSLDLEPGMPILDSIRRNEAIWIDSKAELLATYPHLSSVATPGRRYKIACLPLSSQGRVRGALGLTIESEGSLTSEERGFLQVIARYATQALERLRLFELERESRAMADAAAHRLRVMARISRAFVESELELPGRLKVVTAELSAALEGCINIALVGADQRLHFVAGHHPLPDANEVLQGLIANSPVRLGEGVTGTIAATHKSILLPSIGADTIVRAPREYQSFLQRFPVYALVGAPLTVQGRVIGTVTATRTQPGQTYTAEDLSLLEELADRAAVAIENSRLFQETVAARSRADLLYGFAHAVSTAATLRDVYEAALTTIESALGTARLAILTSDAEGKPRFRAWRKLSDSYRAAVDGHSPWGREDTTFDPVLVADAFADPAMAPFVELFRKEQIRSLGFFPLVIGGRLLGKFMVYFDAPHVFESHEVELAGSIANHLASVITRFQAINRLEDTIKSNELFAAVLAHDLRNPLGAIMNSAQAVLMRQEGRATPAHLFDSQPLSRILRSGQRMTTMIDQLLDFTRARSGGGIHIEPHAANLGELCSQAISELELANPSWTIRCEGRGNSGGVWDAARILQVISNLVGNAGHHGTPGRDIHVSIDGQAPHEVRFEVRNDGAIPAEVRSSLFEPFLAAHRREAASSGLGLGLFIVREIVRAHDGNVTIDSDDTQTVARVRLPRVVTKTDT